MSRQPAGRPRDKRKGRRRIVPPPAATRARVAPIPSATKVAEPASTPAAPARRVPGMMDFSYVGSELRRILVFMVVMLGLIIGLSIAFR
jgi:hypothetical protein